MGAYLRAMLVVFAAIAVPAISYAADYTPLRSGSRSVVAVAPAINETVIVDTLTPIVPAPVVRYGCKRIWRCDALICEWRRGCYGIYGYMEGPYHSLDLAKRQWEHHGWPTPREYQPRYSLSK